MGGAGTIEKLAIRVHLLARLASELRVDGLVWQELLFRAARSCPHARAQGPGYGTLFGRTGGTGLSAEIDVALDDGRGHLALLEGKAYGDYELGRDRVFVFDGKVADHERRLDRGRKGVFALLASAGRVGENTLRWSFACGVDVADPDRLPLAVLARLPSVYPRACDRLEEPHLHEYLVDALGLTSDELTNGPVLLRDPTRSRVLRGDRLGDLVLIQSRLSEDLIRALTGLDPVEAKSGAIAGRILRDLKSVGLDLQREFVQRVAG